MSIDLEKSDTHPMVDPVDCQNYLVITGCPPGDDGVGAILQKQILSCLPRESLSIVTMTPRETPSSRTAENPWVDLNLPARYMHAARPADSFLGDLISNLAFRFLASKQIRGLVDASVQYAKAKGCEAVFAVLESPPAIFTAAEIAKRLNLPLRCFVMDGPNIHIRDYGYGRSLAKKLLSAFDDAMHRADRIAVAGEAMQAAYRDRYGKEGAILRQGAEVSDKTESREITQREEFTIGFAGSLTGHDAFLQLVKSLDVRKWTLLGKPVRMRIIGTHIRLVPSGPQMIEYLGWRHPDELTSLLSDCDVLYLPQPFLDRDREFAELSFPNKLCSYVPTGKPIALHAPPSASLHAFFANFDCGPRSDQLDGEPLVKQIEELLDSNEKYSHHCQQVEIAHKSELNQQRLREEAIRFLGNHAT